MATDGGQRIAELEREVVRLQHIIKDRVARDGGECRLIWPDKPDPGITETRQTLPMLTDAPALAYGSGSRPNLLIEGDNFPALIELSYTHGPVFGVIYIDPPYATNSSAIGYEDGFDHSEWLSMMKPRLVLAKHLLAPDGFIAISIDDNEMARLVLLCEQVFGEKSVKVVAVKMSEAAGVKMTHKKIHKLKEYVIFAKPGGVKGVEIELVAKEEWDEAYNQFLDGLTRDARSNIDDLVAGDVTEASVARVEALLAGVRIRTVRDAAVAAGVAVKDKKAFAAWRGDNAWRIVRFTNGSGSVRRLALDKAARQCGGDPLLALRTPKGVLRIARRDNGDTLLFADNYLMTSPGDIWTDIKTTSLNNEGGVDFQNGKKPLKLLRRIIKAHPRTDVLVLDFFAGSGSTGEAVVALNADDGGTRRFVLVTRDEEEDAGKGKTGRRLCRDVAYPRLTGQFALENEDGSLRVAQADEMSAAVRAGADGIVAGGVCGKYGASLRFLQATARSISRHEATVRDRAARAVSEIAADTLRLITDCWGRHPASTEEFEIFASEARLLVVLHRYAARERLVTALVAIDSEKQIVIYPSLPGGVADEGWFSKRLGARAEVRPLPDPILRTYNNLVLEARR